MEEGSRLECTITVKNVRFYNQDTDFGIITAEVNKVISGTPACNKWGYIVAKGTMPDPKPGRKYSFVGIKTEDPKWGPQYQVSSMCMPLALEDATPEEKKEFLLSIFTVNQVAEMYATLKDPYQTLLDKDAGSLIQVYGCGTITAARWIERFHSHVKAAKVVLGLREYELTYNMARRLLEAYQDSSDLVLEKVKKNPYVLMELDGFGWKKCDALALKGGMHPHSAERVSAFIVYYLNMMAQNGYTYVYSNSQLMEALLEALGEDIPDEPITEAIRQLGSRLWWSEDHEKVGLARYIHIEQQIADKLLRLRDAESNIKAGDWKSKIHQLEEKQGWSYTDEQMAAISQALNQNIILITGYAGTGKSSVVSAILESLPGYEFAQCALAGRAAARLSEITHSEGYTIHRLLGYPLGDVRNGMFEYYEEIVDGQDKSNYLPYDIIILDEISMVDSGLFLSLINAIAPGSKLIMLGDIGQLESIGAGNIAHDLILSPEIASVQLTKIHRQAEASAIITDSVKVRRNEQLIPKDWTGEETRGELQDLTYHCFLDGNNTYYRVMQQVSALLAANVDIMDIQVISPMKDRGNACTWNINLAIQEMYNPLEDGEEEIVVNAFGKQYSLRLGDKVINTKNNYQTNRYEGEIMPFDLGDSGKGPKIGNCPIFNGNIGIITKLDTEKRVIVVDFNDIGEVVIPSNSLVAIQLGYAITCHKMQGDQCKYVIVALDFSAYALLTKELIYTAMTRAIKHCWIIAQTSALRYAVAQNGVSKKQTLLVELLHDIAHPQIIF